MNVQESDLPSIMASLDICEDPEVKNTPSPEDPVPNYYVLRQRPSSSSETNRKRRCLLKPSKLNNSLKSHPKDYYIHSVTHRSSRLLETIYEEPVTYKNGRVKHTGSCKPRKIRFCGITKAKAELHRKLKHQTNKNRIRIQRKINMDEFIAKFHELMGTKEMNESVDAKEDATNTTS